MKRGFYKTKYELLSTPLNEIIDNFLYMNAKAVGQSVRDLIVNKNYTLEDIKERNIKIGPLVQGEAYFHEKDEYYDVIGLLVKSEFEFNGCRTINYGFRSLYLGKCDKSAPVDFDEGYSLEPEGTFGNGFGDYVEIHDEIKSQNEVDKCIKDNNIDINKYLKESGLLLLEKNNKRNIKSYSQMEV